MAKRERKTYSDAQREEILATAQREGLTAEGIQKKFGVKPVTYYSWRKKKGLKGPRGRKPGVARAGAALGGDLGSQVRAGVQAKVRELLPGIVREEVSRYLDSVFGGSSGAKRPRAKAARKKK
ncbi:MAG: transposase [Candidatus Eisenbacteria bacterium]|nr:transposase [Candidatus Eisenbacteria bacterium]